MKTATLVLEYLKVILTAPVLFSVIAGVFIFKFREDLKALLLRVAKLNNHALKVHGFDRD